MPKRRLRTFTAEFKVRVVRGVLAGQERQA
jgi:hypothetical protein